MKLPQLTASKGIRSAHYTAFNFLAPICCLLGIGLAPKINWFHAGLLCVATFVTYAIAHAVHDSGHATAEYKTLSRKGLKTLAIILAFISASFIIYFVISVSLWVLAFAAVIPLVVLYRKGLIYTPFCFSGGLAVCVLGGYFVMAETLSLPAILMAVFVLLLAQGGLLLYKCDEWMTESVGVVQTNCISKENYNRAIGYLCLIVLSLLPLTIAVLLH